MNNFEYDCINDEVVITYIYQFNQFRHTVRSSISLTVKGKIYLLPLIDAYSEVFDQNKIIVKERYRNLAGVEFKYKLLEELSRLDLTELSNNLNQI